MKENSIYIFIIALISFSVNAQTLNPTYAISAPTLADSFKGGYTFSYATAGTPWNGSLISYGGFTNQYDCQISSQYSPGNHISFRTKNGDSDLWNPWYELWHSGNLNNVNSDFLAKTIKSSALNVFGNNPDATNIILSADYADSFRWRIKTKDRGNAIDLDFTSSDSNDTQEDVLKLSRSNSGRPQFQLYNNAIVANNGNVGIGTANPTSKLTVAGDINAREVRVTVNAGADFVFENNYELPPLQALDEYIKANKHLPEVPSAKTMQQDGINLSEMNIKLLQKIEELSLYAIEQDKKNNLLQLKIKNLENENGKFKSLSDRLEKLENK
ncbi:hypothetical protein [Flavobacterium sp.]|uniref:hypothetical protein n=1 Tax=Flavobacterium sp. TaxID=239 RepID=UPI00374DE307